MAEPQGEKAATPPAASAPAGSRRMLSAVTALLLGLAVGGGVGIVAGGTLLAAWRSGSLESQEHGGGGGGGHHSGSAEASSGLVHTIDALVVNPAGSDGLRFLMATMVVEVDGPGTLEQLERRDAEVREALLRTLGSKTVAELASVGSRDSLKAELRQALLSVLDRGDVRRIHLPQFVIQ